MVGIAIGRPLLDEFQGVATGIFGIAEDHRKCLACHCYREVAEEAAGTLEVLIAHDALIDGGVPDGFVAVRGRIRELLASSEGTHG